MSLRDAQALVQCAGIHGDVAADLALPCDADEFTLLMAEEAPAFGPGPFIRVGSVPRFTQKLLGRVVQPFGRFNSTETVRDEEATSGDLESRQSRVSIENWNVAVRRSDCAGFRAALIRISGFQLLIRSYFES